MSEPIICEFCGALLTPATAQEFDDKILCEHCLEENTTLCYCCLDRIWRDEADGDDTHSLCHYCYETTIPPAGTADV